MQFGDIAQIVVTIFASVMASSGLWAYATSRSKTKDAQTQLLLGLAHDRIVYLGMAYIERGYITKDEFEDFHKYLYAPYEVFGGNGLAEKVYKEVLTLPINKQPLKESE